MPALKADLSVRLDAGSLVTKLLGDIGGPITALQGLNAPEEAGDESVVAGISGGLDLSTLGGAISNLSGSASGVVSGLPVASDVLGGLSTALELVESVTVDDLPAKLKALSERVSAELGGREGDFLSVLERLSAMVADSPELRAVLDLLSRILRLGGVQLGAAQLGGNPLPAAIGTLRALGALMSLESTLAEGDRLTAIMARQLDSERVALEFASLRAAFDVASEQLDLAASADPPEFAVDDAESAIAACSIRLAEVEDFLARGMGFGEATLVQLDLAALDADLERALAILRTVDADAIAATVRGLLDRFRPVLDLDLPGAASSSLDGLLTLIEGKVADIAAAVSSISVTPITQPLAQGLGRITGVLQQVSALIEQVTAALRSALDTVRQAVSALPFDEITSAVQTVLAPIGAAMDAVRDLVAGIQSALGTLASSVTGALEDAEGVVDTFLDEAEALLKGAADFLDSLHLDQVVGSVGDGVNSFADVLARAQMKPYFDTAVDVIDTTTEVVEAVPIGLLPESMKADLDAAVEPVRAIDVQQVKTEVMSWFQIVDGKFALRQPIEEALTDLQQLYDELIEEIEKADPRQLVDPINTELKKISDKVNELSPQLTLQPVQDVIDRVKASLGTFDLRDQLAPVTEAFERIAGAIDEYSPERLIQPLEERIDSAREKLVADIRLREWSGKLDELNAQALSLLDRVDPEQLEPLLEAAFAEMDQLLAQLDGLDLLGTFGDFVASFVSGSGLRVHPWTLQVVVGWLTGRPGADELGAHAEHIKASIDATRTAVQSADTQALVLDLTGRVGALRTKIALLPDGSADRVRLTVALDRVRPNAGLAALTPNRARYLAALQAGGVQADALRRRGLSEVQQAVTGLTAALSPLNLLKDFFKSILAQVGIQDTSGGIAGVVRSVIAVAGPSRLAGILVPVFQAFRGRIVALLNGVLTPLKEGIAQLIAVVDALDLGPLREGVHGIVEEAKSQVLSLSPETLLKPALDAFDALKAELLAFDPLQDIRALLEALQTTIVRVLGKLDANRLLEQPIRIFDEIMDALRALDIDTLLAPVLDQLDAIAGQVSSGLDRTAEAIERLQDALPEPGSSGGLAASVGIDVSVGF